MFNAKILLGYRCYSILLFDHNTPVLVALVQKVAGIALFPQ